MANSPIPASVVIMTCGIDDLFDQPRGSLCSSKVTCVVFGDSDSMDQPCRSIWVRMMLGSVLGGMRGKRSVLSTEKPKMWTEEGDL